MKLITLVIVFIAFSNIGTAQGDKIRFEVIPSYSKALYGDWSFTDIEGTSADYSPIITNSISISYIKSISKRLSLGIGLEFFNSGVKVRSYQINPASDFKGQSSIFKMAFIQIPINLIYTLQQFKIELGISSNLPIYQKIILLSENKVNSGYLHNDMAYNSKYQLGLNAGFFYAIELAEKLDLSIGLKPQYIFKGRRLNIGLSVGIDYYIN